MRRIPFLVEQSRGSVTMLSRCTSTVSAQAVDWPGIILEAGQNDVAEVNDAMLPHHFVALNLSRRPGTLEVKTPSGFRRVVVPPIGIWFCPAHTPFTLRPRHRNAYVRISMDPVYFERSAEGWGSDFARPPVMRQTVGPAAPQLVHLLHALAAEARLGTPSGLAYVDALRMAIGLQLLSHAGERVPARAPARGGLSPVARRRVLEVMHDRPDASLTVGELAEVAGLSPAHFARAFRESVGRAPHQYLLGLRLERARRLLELPGATLSDTAQRAGFADQAHFTRLFKRHFGVTPGRVLRANIR